MSRLGFKPEHIDESVSMSIGSRGTDIFNDTNTHMGTWKVGVLLEASTIDSYTDNGLHPSVIITGSELPAGTYISANDMFTAIKLSGGTIAMYRA